MFCLYRYFYLGTHHVYNWLKTTALFCKLVFLYRTNREGIFGFLFKAFSRQGRDLFEYFASNMTPTRRELLGKGLCEWTSPSCKVTEASDVKAFHVLNSLLVTVMGHMDLELCCCTQIAVAPFQSCSPYSCLAPVCGNRINLSSALPLGVTTVRNSCTSLPKFNTWALGVMLVVSWLNLCTGFYQ